MLDLILSVMVLAAIALGIGAYALWRKGVSKQAMLMAILAFIMVINVAIWLVPTQDGASPAQMVSENAEEAEQ